VSEWREKGKEKARKWGREFKLGRIGNCNVKLRKEKKDLKLK
jgi:hypothetical protein